MHPLAAGLIRIRDHITDDFLGGPKALKFAWANNLQACATIPFVLMLMLIYDVWTPTAWTYLALHGSYGVVWMLKEYIFPDAGWQRRITLAGALNVWLTVLGLYWIAPVLIVTGRIEQPPAVLCAAVILSLLGMAIWVGADAQKYFVLRLRSGLITDGFFARTRNPGYLGDMMIYASFAIVAGHWLPWLVLAWVWSVVFYLNMLRKDASMSRHPEWASYKARTGMLLPSLRINR